MKKVFCLIVMINLSFLSYSNSTPIALQSLSLSGGEGPLSTGLFFEANFTREKDLLTMYLGERDICVYYLKSLGSKMYLGPSWEYYYNTPALGLMFLSTPLSWNSFSLSTFSWGGFAAGHPSKGVDFKDWQFLFFYNSASLNYAGLSLSFAVLWYDDWGHLVDLKYTKQVNKDISLFTSAGYSWYGDEKFLFKFGMTYSLNKN